MMAPQAMDTNMAPGWGRNRDLHIVLSTDRHRCCHNLQMPRI